MNNENGIPNIIAIDRQTPAAGQVKHLRRSNASTISFEDNETL